MTYYNLIIKSSINIMKREYSFMENIPQNIQLKKSESHRRSPSNQSIISKFSIEKQLVSSVSREKLEQNNLKGSVEKKNRKSLNEEIKEDEFMFQLKLKLISLIKKLNIDYRSYLDMKEEPIETILEVVFKKMKNFIKEAEGKEKQLVQQVRIKEIKILELTHQKLEIQEQLDAEKRKASKMKDRITEELSEYQKLLKQGKQENGKIQAQLLKQKKILKQQSQYIKILQTDHGKVIQLKEKKVLELQREIKNLEDREFCHKNDYLHNQRVFEETIEKYKEEILTSYRKSEEFEKQKQKWAKKLEQKQNEIHEIRGDQKQIGKDYSHKMKEKQQQILMYCSMYRNEISENGRLKAEIKQLQKEIQGLKSLYNEQTDNHSLRIKISQMTIQTQSLQRKLKKAESDKEFCEFKNQEKERQLEEMKKKMQNLKLKKGHLRQNEKQKMKQIIEEWKIQLQITVKGYQSEIEKLEKILTEKNQQINRLSQSKAIK